MDMVGAGEKRKTGAVPSRATTDGEGEANGKVRELFGVLDDSLSALSVVMGDLSAGKTMDRSAVERMAETIAAAAGSAGYAQLADVANALPPAVADPDEFDWAVFRLYETLEGLEDSEDDVTTDGFRVRASAVLRSWCADRVWQVLAELTTAIEALDGRSNLDSRCRRIAKLLHYVSYACRADDLPEATKLTMALSDLFDRDKHAEGVAPKVVDVARTSIPILRDVLGSIQAGYDPAMVDVEDLARQVSEIQSASHPAPPPGVVERRLGLPAPFHGILTAESVAQALSALHAKKSFFIVRADLNADETCASAFAEWLAGDAATPIGNVTVFDSRGTLWDFLIATTLDPGGLTRALGQIDPSGARLRIERTLSDSAAR
jgi:two-component system chemotaxis sensor kinase CheA